MLLKWQVKKSRLSETERFIELWHEEESLWNILLYSYNISGKKRKKVLEECRKNKKWQIINHFFKMFIWILILWMRDTAVSKAYSEPSRTSKMELFAKIANCFQPLTIFILDVRQESEYAFGSWTI